LIAALAVSGTENAKAHISRFFAGLADMSHGKRFVLLLALACDKAGFLADGKEPQFNAARHLNTLAECFALRKREFFQNGTLQVL
jgi:hypothetical protein